MGILNIKRPLVLATASPARRKLVLDAGIEFSADAVNIDETPLSGESVRDYVKRLAKAKAETVVPPFPNAIIVAVDTAIGLDGRIIGKPEDEAHARKILQTLSGRFHDVVSAIALKDVKGARTLVEVTRTKVKFIRLTPQTISWYISTGEWKDRAGAYAIQGRGAALIAEVRGCFTNVIGISIPSLLNLLEPI